MIAPYYCTLVQALFAAPPEKLFITEWHDEDDVNAVTFGEFIHLAKLQAAGFLGQGLLAGDRVILIMPQGIALMVAFAGAMMVGAVPAILAYPNFKADPDKYAAGLIGVTQNLQARLVLVDEEFPSALSHRIPMADSAQLISNPPLSLGSTEPSLPVLSLDSRQLAFIQHSAGTTGLQTGVALSHRAVLTQLHHLVTALQVREQDSIYSWLPLYHDMGLIACFMLPLTYHVSIVMQSPIEWVMRPGTMLQLITEFRCTLAWLPNFAFQFLARRVRAEDRERSIVPARSGELFRASTGTKYR